MHSNDIISMEYESHAMINEEQYLRIYQDNLNSNFEHTYLENTNIYYDTPDLFLINHQMVLRLRGVKDKYNEVTLKIEEENGIKEINYPVKKDEVVDFEKFPVIKEELEKRGINLKDIRYITTLITKRLEVKKDGYLFVIDKNTYGTTIDYNLEVESSSKELAEHYLDQELAKYQIQKEKNYIVKSKRAILAFKK